MQGDGGVAACGVGGVPRVVAAGRVSLPMPGVAHALRYSLLARGWELDGDGGGIGGRASCGGLGDGDCVGAVVFGGGVEDDGVLLCGEDGSVRAGPDEGDSRVVGVRGKQDVAALAG